MFTALALTLFTATPALEIALQRALMRSPARVELVNWEPPRCKGEFVPAPFENSGRVAVKVRGSNCEAWGWAHVKVIVPVATLLRDVRGEESLEGAWSVSEGEAQIGGLAALPGGSSATRSLKRGAVLTERDVRVGPKPGTSITVRLVIGALSLEQRGTVSPCVGVATCATLPSGKRVAGTWFDGVLHVEEGR